MRTSGDTDIVAPSARKSAATQGGTKVTTLAETQALISSSLRAVDLRGLTGLELAFFRASQFYRRLAERLDNFAVFSGARASSSSLAARSWE